MRPLTLTMEGFGAFRRRTAVDFTDADLVALVGPTGSGKSTIIDALTFALYGSVVRYDDNKLVAPVVHQLAHEARVQLEFELRGVTYRATRVVRRTKTGATTPEARLDRAEETIADRARDVTDRVTALLGLDAEQFNKTVVLPQGRFAEFLHDKPADRQATLRRLLDLGLYARLGQAARQRAATAKAQADGYEQDVAAARDALSDDRRAELTAAAAAADAVAEQLAAAVAALDHLDAELAPADRRCDGLVVRAARLTVDAPVGVAELARDRAAAVQAVAAADATVDTHRAARRAAVEAAAAGPDLPASQLHHAAHQRHQRARDAVAATERAGPVRRAERDEAETAAGAVRAERAELADVAARADEQEHDARRQLAALPAEAEIRERIGAHERLRAARQQTATLVAARDQARVAVDTATAERDDAVAAADRARTELTDRQLHAGAAGLTAALRVGEPCPVCHQLVSEQPEPARDADLTAARGALDLAEATMATASTAWRAAGDELARRDAALSAHEQSIASADAVVADSPPEPELRTTLAEIEETAAAVAAARTAATEARTACRQAERDPTAAAILQRAEVAGAAWIGHEARLATLVEQVTAAAADLVGLPDATTAAANVELAQRLDDARRHAEADLDAAETAAREARAVLARGDARLADVARELRDARDRLADLGPPAVDADDVAAGWAALTGWCRTLGDETAQELAAAEADRARIGAERETLIGEARTAVQTVVPRARGGRDALRDAVVRRQTECAAALEEFDRRRTELVALEERVRARRADEAVASTLGRLLAANGFEGWVMAAALEDLAARATTRLHVLSGGHFSLIVDDREFLVVDHRNADERRSIRTLSGGETFLASLALALALSEATAELAPRGAAPIESIFLDEGFGTLDPETMDVVASAIEELGASGRLVVLVTHIRELADRMPVRMEVSKGPDTAAVERVEV